MVAALLAVTVGANPTSDVVEQIGEGVLVNWTRLTVEIDGQGRAGRVGQFTAVEELARREVAAALRQAIGRLRVSPMRGLAAVMAEDRIGSSVRARSSRWVVEEASYGTSGRVSLRARLSLHDVLKPWLMDRPISVAAPPGQGDLTYSGLLLDARATGGKPHYAPTILSYDGEVVYGNAFDPVHASTRPPARYVLDPAHPDTILVGDRPLVVALVSAVEEGFVLPPLTPEERAAVERLLRSQVVVVVVDAP